MIEKVKFFLNIHFFEVIPPILALFERKFHCKKWNKKAKNH